MSEPQKMPEDAGQEEASAPEKATERPPQKPRPKMTLDEQATFLSRLLERCKMHGPELRGLFAGEATLTLSTDDMLRLETIQQTLAIFDAEGAAELVRREIWRKRQRGSGRG
jgi:hypothetical protein